MLDKNRLAVIHIVKKELGLSDPEYREILEKAAGVTSSKDLDEPGFRKLLRFFAVSRYNRVNKFGVTLRQKMYMGSLARGMNWNEQHLNNFIHKYYHKQGITELTRREAIKVIESLKKVKDHGNKSTIDNGQ
jgi:hypothetical protein